jgi:NADPH-dependent F420 reductase
MPSDSKPTIAIIGGTGPEGRGLASRLAGSGYSVTIGSRDAERAADTAAVVSRPGAGVSGKANADAAGSADLIILTLPYSALAATLPALREHTGGKIVVSAVVALEFREGRMVALRPEAGSAAQEVASALPGARVVGAFQNVDSHVLASNSPVDSDVIVTSDDAEARHLVMDLVGALPGARAVSGGRLAASRYVEEITALLVTLNRIYKSHTGIRITGIQR